jgi:hypothetical protein
MNERAWSTGGMILTGVDGSILRNTCCNVTPGTTYPTWTGLGMNVDLNGDRPATKHLSNGTDIINQLWHVCVCVCVCLGLNQATARHPGALLNMCSHDASFEIKVISNIGISILIYLF